MAGGVVAAAAEIERGQLEQAATSDPSPAAGGDPFAATVAAAATVATAAAAPEYDYLRDGPARYLGYSNEVGEAFRTIAHGLVLPSYAVAFGYVFTDTYDKTVKAGKTASDEDRTSIMAQTAVDTLVWQTAASVAIPGFTINRAVAATTHVLRHHANHTVRRWVPVAVGLGIIPLIVHPIDNFVTFAMDKTTRQLMSPAARPPPPAKHA